MLEERQPRLLILTRQLISLVHHVLLSNFSFDIVSLLLQPRPPLMSRMVNWPCIFSRRKYISAQFAAAMTSGIADCPKFLRLLPPTANPFETATELQNVAAFCSSHLCEMELHARASARSSAGMKLPFLLRFGAALGITSRSVLTIDRTVDKH
jgi:hypothetical protein